MSQNQRSFSSVIFNYIGTSRHFVLIFHLQIQDHLKMLQQQYQDSVNQREGLKERKVLTGLRLQRASVLIAALSDEKVCYLTPLPAEPGLENSGLTTS